METILVLAIAVFAVAYVAGKIYKGLKKGGDYPCSGCATCALCATAVNDKKENR